VSVPRTAAVPQLQRLHQPGHVSYGGTRARETFRAVDIKERLAWQISETMKAHKDRAREDSITRLPEPPSPARDLRRRRELRTLDALRAAFKADISRLELRGRLLPSRSDCYRESQALCTPICLVSQDIARGYGGTRASSSGTPRSMQHEQPYHHGTVEVVAVHRVD
jgi:hypothetical protein